MTGQGTSNIPTALRPERESTDGSLRAERNKTDSELGRKGASVEQKAHDIVDLARDKTDAAVKMARVQADRGAV